jgi:hypothetical protein
MPAQGYARAEMQAAAPLMIRRADRAPLGALLLVIATLWLAAAISGWVGGKAAIIPGFGSSGAYLAGALGAGLAVIALTWMVRGRIVVIGRGTVAVTVWSLHGWVSPHRRAMTAASRSVPRYSRARRSISAGSLARASSIVLPGSGCHSRTTYQLRAP